MAAPLPLPPPTVKLMEDTGKPTQHGREFLERLEKLVRDLNSTTGPALALKAPIASPTFTGDPKAPTPSPGDNDTSIATTAYVTAADAALLASIPAALSVSSTVSPSGTNTSVITGITAGKILIAALQNLSHNSGSNQILRIELSNNNGSSWSSVLSLTAAISGATGQFGLVVITRANAGNIVVTSLIQGTATGAQLASITGQINALRLSWNSGNFDQGDWNVYSL